MRVSRCNSFHFAPFEAIRNFDAAANRKEQPTGTRPWVPAVDILETEDSLILKADLPEVTLENINIQVSDGVLTIGGERKREPVPNEKGYHRIERNYGPFSRSFTLPDTIQPESVKASFKFGVLNIVLPKKESTKPLNIKVEVSN